MIIPAKFQSSSFKTVGGDRGDRHTHGPHALLSTNSNEKSYIARFDCIVDLHNSTSQPGPKNFVFTEQYPNILHYTKFFSCHICLRVGVWGTPGSGGWIGGVLLVLGTFLELVWRSVQNLGEIGLADRAWKSDMGTNNLFYIDKFK